MKILITEDEILTVTYMKRGLQILGQNRVEAVTSGEEALERVMADEPDIIFMDILLAGEINGIETALKIREISQNPIVFTSAYNYKEMIQSNDLLTNCIFLPKPVSVGDLRIAMAKFQK